eukprot:6201571-Pleurochrysis_carterae.AAC.10
MSRCLALACPKYERDANSEFASLGGRRRRRVAHGGQLAAQLRDRLAKRLQMLLQVLRRCV